MDNWKTEIDNLTDDRLAYVMNRAKTKNDSEACRNAGIPRGSYYQWPDREHLNELAQEIKRDIAFQALEKLKEHAVEAADVLTGELHSRDARLRVDVAKDVLDRNGIGKQTQKVDIDAKLSVEYVKDWRVIEDNPTLPA